MKVAWWRGQNPRMLDTVLACLSILIAVMLNAAEAPASGQAGWTIYIANDNCPDYTWGYTEEQTRQAFADIVRAHLDEMKRTDNQPPENQDRYNMAVTLEALCFVKRYPERKDELIRRIQEGRVFVSPFLCNSLWGFQSAEGAVRTLYPARRLERAWGIPMNVAEHIEEPSLPWGMATILAGCGVRWLSNPFYNYDSTFGNLRNPPVFVYEGPDGSRLRVAMDAWAANRASYTQGARLLNNPKAIAAEWLPHYEKLGANYPWRAILASGTHGDIAPHSGNQARGFAEKIIQYNALPEAHPKLVNATLPQFCRAIDEAEQQTPSLPTVRGCFGHSWDLWPVSLAKYVASLREGERAYLAAETLLAVAAWQNPKVALATRAERERAEWCWAMLSDHAWNGTGQQNKRHNAELRRKWGEELMQKSQGLAQEGWAALGLARSETQLTLFNSLSFPRRELVRVLAPDAVLALANGKTLDSQVVLEDGQRMLYFVSPEVAGFSFQSVQLKPGSPRRDTKPKLKATATELESPFYRLAVDAKTGGLTSLIHKATGRELVHAQPGRTFCQTVYFDGQEHLLSDAQAEVVALGSVLARLRITGSVAAIRVTNYVTVYAELDRIDFDLRLEKPPTTKQERLSQVFPVAADKQYMRLETPGAVLRPAPQPAGDLLPGADARRFAVQGFVDVSPPDSPGLTFAPLDAFALRLDLDRLTFQALGNDQNYKEVTQDQDGVRHFRFRYAVCGHGPGYDGPAVFVWSRSVATPLLTARGGLPAGRKGLLVSFDPNRALATCLKTADDPEENSVVMRLWETSDRSGLLPVAVGEARKVVLADLLERGRKDLLVTAGRLQVPLDAHGFACLKMWR